MGLFRRKQGAPQPGGSAARTYLGRKLRSQLDADQCIENFKTLALPEDRGEQMTFEPRWTHSSAPPPDQLIGVWMEDPRPTPPPPRALYLGVWTGEFTHMALVPPDFDPDTPIPLPGQWKMLDPSLASVGWVTEFEVEV